MATQNTEKIKEKLIEDIKDDVKKQIIEQNNADFLIRWINKAETIEEAIEINELGTTYSETGFRYDVRFEKISNTIKYFKKNNKLSFSDKNKKGLPHKLIIGDNYDALQNLLISHYNSIDVIYIDPPYGKDDMGEFAKMNYNNAITRDNLISMLYPRLKLARELLSDEGVIFCSIDDKNQAYIKCLFDKILTENNFIGCLVVQTATDNNPTLISVEHEYVLCYAKNKKVLDKWEKESSAAQLVKSKYEEIKENVDSPAEIQKILRKWMKDNKESLQRVTHYNYVDEKGVYSTSSNNANPHPGGYTFDIIHPVTKRAVPKPANGWRWPESTFLQYCEKDMVVWGKDETTQPHIKKYVDTAKEQLKSIIYDDSRGSTNELSQIFNVKDENNEVFTNPKSIKLMKMLMSFINKDDITVLDFFAGSGTTGHAVLELNKNDKGTRRFILCTSNEITEINPNGIAIDVTSKRLKRIMTGECYDGTNDFEWISKKEKFGGSLDVYEIGSVSNFENVDGKTPFDVIDETLYDLPAFSNTQDKIKWVCDNFERTQCYLEEVDE